jgi:glycosyltransferase involved in cell wall biosynthesis
LRSRRFWCERMEIKRANFLQVWADPLVFVLSSGEQLFVGLRHCINQAAGRPFHILVVPYWHIPTMVDGLRRFALTVEAMSNKVRVHFACPSKETEVELKKVGLSTVFAHHNAFVDEQLFRPQPHLPKKYQTIHNAALPDWKRHNLVWNAKDICLVTYRHNPNDQLSNAQNYKNLAWSNVNADGSLRWVQQEELCQLICSSKIGLILSELEGGNFASAEYQFCGVPLLTTPARGGRLDFIDNHTAYMVHPTEENVLQAIEWAQSQEFDAADISRRTLARAILHRIRLLEWLSDLSGQNVTAQANANAWLPTFVDKLRSHVEVDYSLPMP